MKSYEKLHECLSKFAAQLDIEHKVLTLKSPVELTSVDDVTDILYLVSYYKASGYQINGLDELNEELAEIVAVTNESDEADSNENSLEKDLQDSEMEIINILGGGDAIVHLVDVSSIVRHAFVNFQYHSSLAMVLKFDSDKSQNQTVNLTIDDYNLSELIKTFFNKYEIRAKHFVDVILSLVEIQKQLDNHQVRQSEVSDLIKEIADKYPLNEEEDSELIPVDNEPDLKEVFNEILQDSSRVIDAKSEKDNSDLQKVTVELGGVQRTFEIPAYVKPTQIVKFILSNTDKFDKDGKFIVKMKIRETKHELNKEAAPKCTCNCKARKAGNCKRCTHNRCKRTEHCRCIKYKSDNYNKTKEKVSDDEQSKRQKVRAGVDFLVNTYGIDSNKARQLILDILSKK